MLIPICRGSASDARTDSVTRSTVKNPTASRCDISIGPKLAELPSHPLKFTGDPCAKTRSTLRSDATPQLNDMSFKNQRPEPGKGTMRRERDVGPLQRHRYPNHLIRLNGTQTRVYSLSTKRKLLRSAVHRSGRQRHNIASSVPRYSTPREPAESIGWRASGLRPLNLGTAKKTLPALITNVALVHG